MLCTCCRLIVHAVAARFGSTPSAQIYRCCICRLVTVSGTIMSSLSGALVSPCQCQQPLNSTSAPAVLPARSHTARSHRWRSFSSSQSSSRGSEVTDHARSRQLSASRLGKQSATCHAANDKMTVAITGVIHLVVQVVHSPTCMYQVYRHVALQQMTLCALMPPHLVMHGTICTGWYQCLHTASFCFASSNRTIRAWAALRAHLAGAARRALRFWWKGEPGQQRCNWKTGDASHRSVRLHRFGSNSEGPHRASNPGATGLVGCRLVARLAAQGHSVRVLTRSVGAARGKLPYGRLEFYAPPDWAKAFAGATAVVNLAGERPLSLMVPL